MASLVAVSIIADDKDMFLTLWEKYYNDCIKLEDDSHAYTNDIHRKFVNAMDRLTRDSPDVDLLHIMANELQYKNQFSVLKVLVRLVSGIQRRTYSHPVEIIILALQKQQQQRVTDDKSIYELNQVGTSIACLIRYLRQQHIGVNATAKFRNSLLGITTKCLSILSSVVAPYMLHMQVSHIAYEFTALIDMLMEKKQYLSVPVVYSSLRSLFVHSCDQFDICSYVDTLTIQLLATDNDQSVARLIASEREFILTCIKRRINTEVNAGQMNALVSMVNVVIKDLCVHSSSTATDSALLLADLFNLTDLKSLVRETKKRNRVTSFAKKGKWQMACEVALSSPLYIRVELYNYLKAHSMFKAAASVYQQCNLHSVKDVEPVTDVEIQLQEDIESAAYVKLPLSDECVILVDSMQSLLAAKEIWETHPHTAVGIDAEWRASIRTQYASNAGACILQLSIEDYVFIFDLLVIRQTSHITPMGKATTGTYTASLQFLSSIMQDTTIVKVGWDFDRSDRTMIRQAGYGSILKSARVLEIGSKLKRQHVLKGKASSATSSASTASSVYGQKIQMMRQQCMALRGKDNISLSDAALFLLGQPLNKAEQLSSWDERPLRAAQLRYAALDSHILLCMYDMLLVNYGLQECSINMGRYYPVVHDYVVTKPECISMTISAKKWLEMRQQIS